MIGIRGRISGKQRIETERNQRITYHNKGTNS